MTSIKEALEAVLACAQSTSPEMTAAYAMAEAALATFQPDGERREAIALQIWNDRLKRRGETTVTMETVIRSKERGFDILAMDRPTADAIIASGLVQDEAGWLIEMGDPPVYHCATADHDEQWALDAGKALRFARREDAQSYSDHVGWTSPPVRIVEHMGPIRSARDGGSET